MVSNPNTDDQYPSVYQPDYDVRQIGSRHKWQTQFTQRNCDIDGDGCKSGGSSGDKEEFDVSHVDMGVLNVAYDVKYALAGDSANTYTKPITGYWSWDSLEMNEDVAQFMLTKQGMTTGQTTGHLFYVDSNYDWFACDADGAGGDSGAPIYREDPNGNGVKTAGIVSTGVNISGSTNPYGAVGGNHIGAILDGSPDWNLQFRNA